MAWIDLRMEALGFSTDVALTFEEVVAVADAAAGRSTGGGHAVVRCEVEPPDFATYEVVRGGRVPLGLCRVRYTAGRAGGGRVAFVVGDYVVSRPRVLGLLPRGPETSRARRPLGRFARDVRRGLAVAAPV